MYQLKYLVSLAGISLSIAALAAPPAPELPQGACAGLLKKNTLSSFSPSDLAARAGIKIGTPNIAMYFDFDNSLFYLNAIEESGAAAENQSADDFTTTKTSIIADGNEFSVSVSTALPYALNVEGLMQYAGEEEQIRLVFIPANSGTTFFVHGIDSPEAGVCQKI